MARKQCQVCGQPATVRVETNLNGRHSTMLLCDDHYRQLVRQQKRTVSPLEALFSSRSGLFEDFLGSDFFRIDDDTTIPGSGRLCRSIRCATRRRARHYGNIRATAEKWLQEVEIPPSRIDDLPTTFSGGMQQRLQIARNLVTQPKLVFMDEPTGGLDVSVQARLLDLLRGLAVELNLAVVIVTHDLGVARLLANRLLVMKQGQVVESGLTDRVLDDPHHPYTQLLVSSVLQN